MLGHLSMVYCGKWFSKNRGKAVAVANSGYTLAEASLPSIFVILLSLAAWKLTWYIPLIASSAILLSILIFLNSERNSHEIKKPELTQFGMKNKSWTRSEMLKSWVFWIALPGLMTSPMFTTTLFFHQVHLVNIKEWEMAAFVMLIPFYSFTSLFSLYIFGYLVDRFDTKTLLPFFLLPLIIGLGLLSIAKSYPTLLIVFILLGLMQGAYSVVYGTFFPEFFGTKNLASIRTVGLAIMVFSSSVGPVISGYFIDLGFEIDNQFMIMCYFGIFASLLFLPISLKVKFLHHSD
jgi:MFS family permease